ncbi:hypothetical protein RUM43_002181 [Polyplax serrata]|uniref:Myosin motor domain-containing protein n=1 Tax=Polyplax serrata TaxID=468196 RepID=A0AAN8NYG6_POLSC
MKSLKQSQSIIVSGESGAGKTESTKYLLRYLCELWGSAAGPVEQKILDANPVLEAFGNAKTTRNNNSSRFGKFMEVHFDNKYQVVGGFISHYLLEKSRICVQSSEERNYHVFYLLCAGAPEKLRRDLNITNPDDYRYLNKGCTQYFSNSSSEKVLNNSQKSESQQKKGGLKDPMLDDFKDFTSMDQALSRLGLTDQNKLDIYTIVAAVLHLGNVTFEDNPQDSKGGCQVCPVSEKSLVTAATLLGVDKGELRQALVSKVMMTNRGGMKGTVIMVPLKVYEANSARDALAKALYSNLFDHIVRSINKSIPFQASSYYIGVLDIAGFEYFTVNSFEQFCINYCNEKLQQFFNQRILKDEQELYKKEALKVEKIEFVDNQDCIDLVETKGTGIFNLLDEESKLPKPSPIHFTTEVHRVWNGHFRLALPRTSKLKAHREIRDDEGFLVRHFAGAVCYHTAQFIEKNNDALHTSLECLVQESRNKFLQSLFPVTNNSQQKGGKLAFDSVGLKFKTQLGELMDKLESTGTSFVRCIKPNQKMNHHEFEGGNILSQLQCSGMTSVLELMQMGFPSRAIFSDLYNMYQKYMTEDLKRLDHRLFCKVLLHAMGMNEKDYSFGITKVFFRPGKFAEFDLIMKSDPENLKKIINKVRKWLITHRWKVAQWCALSVIKLKNKILYRRENLITVQKNVRMFLSKKKHAPRYKTIMKVKGIESMLSGMESISQQLKNKTATEAEVKALKSEIMATCLKIKSNPSIKVDTLNETYNQLLDRANKLMASLQDMLREQKKAEEQERLRKIQEDMEKERKRKEEEEKMKMEYEENLKKKAEIENRRKLEEKKREQDELTKRDFEILKAEQEKEEARLREQMEQERRDHELALRLANECNSQVEELSTVSKTLDGNKNITNYNKKYDLSKWKYSELRDTINTSCDIELLEACRHEFHRRLKVYHAWKAKNNKKAALPQNERAPKAIMDEANRATRLNRVSEMINGNSSQRYFRIPFVRPNLQKSLTEGHENDVSHNQTMGKKGWWYAHFDGQYVARQMELHPDKSPILLVAGIDDMQMCELSLEETGLNRKKGAEILEHEFDKEWLKNGGKPYVRPSQRAK